MLSAVVLVKGRVNLVLQQLVSVHCVSSPALGNWGFRNAHRKLLLYKQSHELMSGALEL